MPQKIVVSQSKHKAYELAVEDVNVGVIGAKCDKNMHAKYDG